MSFHIIQQLLHRRPDHAIAAVDSNDCLDHEQSLAGQNASVDYPTRTLAGADLQLTEQVGLFAEQEWTRDDIRDTLSSRIGLKTTPWSGGQVGASLGRNDAVDGDRLFANLGLAQTWRISDRWRLDAGLDRSQSLAVSESPSAINPNYPIAAGSAEDFTAVSGGAGYDETSWSWVGRLESRWSQERDKWGLVSGIAGQVHPGLGLSAGVELFQERIRNGADTLGGDLKLSAAWRPDHGDWIILDRLSYILDQQYNNSGEILAQRIVNNFNCNFKPFHRWQLAMQYGAKYVFDTIDHNAYTGYTDLIGIETRYDLTPRWDIGVQLGLLHGWQLGQLDYRSGVSVGYTVFKNAWISFGYNFLGFQDQDFSAADYTAQGPYVKFRLKMDQQSVKEMVSWFKRD